MSNNPAYNAPGRHVGAGQGGGEGMNVYAHPRAGYMNEMRGGDVTDFVAQITRVVTKGSRAFAILDSDKYLPLTGLKDCPRPMGLHMRVGQWLKVQARLNTNSSNNPWTCTRVYCQVDGPYDQAQKSLGPTQHMYAGAKRGAGDMMSAGDFGPGEGRWSQHGPKIPWQHGPDARQDAASTTASDSARSVVSYGADGPPLTDDARDAGPGDRGDGFWARRAAAAAAAEQGETMTRPWPQDERYQRPQAHPGAQWQAQQGRHPQYQQDFWTAEAVQQQRDASEGGASARSVGPPHPGSHVALRHEFNNGNPERVAAGSEGARWQQQQQQYHQHQHQRTALQPMSAHDLPRNYQDAEERGYAAMRQWGGGGEPHLGPRPRVDASGGRLPYQGSNDDVYAGIEPHGGMPRTQHGMHPGGYRRQENGGGALSRHQRGAPYRAQHTVPGPSHAQAQTLQQHLVPASSGPAGGGHLQGMNMQGAPYGAANNANMRGPPQQMLARHARAQAPAPPPDIGGQSRQEQEPASLLRDLHKIKRIQKLLQYLDHTLRTCAWPSSSTDACAALFKMANLAIADGQTAGKLIVQWDNSHGLLCHLLQRVRQDVMSLTPVAISQGLWALGKSLVSLATHKGHKSGVEGMQQTLDALATELVMRAPLSLPPQVVATSVYGIAKAGYSSTRLHHYFDAVEGVLVNHDVGNFSNQHLANIAWSFAFYRRPGQRIMHVVERELRTRNLTEFKNGELSMTLWACAKYKYASESLYPLLAEELSERGLANCTAQELANLAWALTAGGAETGQGTGQAGGGGLASKTHPFADVIRAIAQTCVERKLVWRGANDVRNILSCVLKARTSDGGLCSAVAEELGKRSEAGTLRAWVQSFWMFAHMRYMPPASLVATFQRRMVIGTLVSSDAAYISKAHYAVAKFAAANDKVLQNLDMIRNNSQALRPTVVPRQKQAAAHDDEISAHDERQEAADGIELLWALTALGRDESARRLANRTAVLAAGLAEDLSAQHLLLLVWSLGASSRQPAAVPETGSPVPEEHDPVKAGEPTATGDGGAVGLEVLSVLYKALASRLLALENASELQEEAVALCVSVGASRASALEAAQQRAADGQEPESKPAAGDADDQVAAAQTGRTAGEYLRGEEMRGFWTWVREDRLTGKGQAARKKAVERLLSFLDALE